MPDLTPAGNVVGSSLSSTTFIFSPIAASGASSRRRRSSDGGGHIMGILPMCSICTWAGRSVSGGESRSEEHTSELQSLMRISYAVFCLKKKRKKNVQHTYTTNI